MFMMIMPDDAVYTQEFVCFVRDFNGYYGKPNGSKHRIYDRKKILQNGIGVVRRAKR